MRMISVTKRLLILNCLSFSVVESGDFNKYPRGIINRTISKISYPDMEWIKENCGIKKDTTEIRREIGFKIYEGQQTRDFEYPWAVGLSIWKLTYRFSTDIVTRLSASTCSGSLISKKHVLTSQHCFDDEQSEEKKQDKVPRHETRYKAKLTIGKGNQNKSYWLKTEESSRYLLERNYRGNCKRTKYDWALVELEEEVPQWLLESKAVVPVCLPASDEPLADFDQVQVYGQGGSQMLWEGLSKGSGIMRYVYTYINNTEVYNRKLELCPDIFSIGPVTRKGDSGGGVTKDILLENQCKHVLIGITRGMIEQNQVAVDVRSITDLIQNLTGILV